MPTFSARARSLTAAAAVLVAAGFYLWWEVVHRGVFAYNQSIYAVDDADEWRYTACSRLVEHGYALFSQVFSAQPPLLFLSLAGGLRLVQDSILGARWTEIAFGLLGLLCAVWVSWLIAGPWAGAATAALLAVSPGFLLYSHTVEAEGPMMALVTLALALALASRRTGGSGLSLLSGLALAAGILTKLFALWAVPAALWAILIGREGLDRRQIRSAGLLIAGAALPVALDFGLVQPGQQWAQVVQMHERAAGLQLSNTTPPIELLGQFLGIDLGLSLLAAAGIVALLALGRWRDAVFFLLWLPAGLLMLFLFRPLFQHHPAILLTALACSAGVGIAVALDARPRSLAILPVVLGLAAYVLLLPRLAHADRHFLVAGQSRPVAALVAYVRAHSAASDFVAADDLAVADEAQRLVPPPLCDPSNIRLRAGYLTAADLIGATRQYHARLVLPSFGIYQQVGGYMAWLREHYRPQPAPGGFTAFVPR